MKKIKFSRWLLTALAAMTVFGSQAGSKRFTAVTSNVDGLPPEVNINYTIGNRTVKMNPDGSQETGARRMGQLIGENLWDIVALSEDFNYHDYILEGVSSYYNAAKWRGKIEQKNLHGSLLNFLSITVTDNKGLYMQTDGLGFLTRNKYQVTPVPNDEKEGGNWTPWGVYYGVTDNESDGLIRKGFRFYTVTLSDGLVVDVYITHMEAGSTEGDNNARAQQIDQFAKYILAHKGNNPIIILGDTNCRYTRDPLEEKFINVINADPDLTIMDPWVEHMREGEYPTFGSGSIMTDKEGQQKGEVVDKIFYINNKKSKCTLTCESYLHDTSFTYADGSQIADHLPVVGTFVITNPDAPEPVSAEVTIPEAPEKGAIVSGGTYFIRNVGSGEFIKAGGAWTTQAVMGDYPSKVFPTNKGGDKWSLKTTHDNKWIRFDGSNYFMDQDETNWTLTPVAGKPNVYTMKDGNGNPVSHANHIVAVAASADSNDPNQQWEFLTKEDMLHELYFATSTKPKDVTFLLKAPDFGYKDQESWTTSKGNNATQEKIRPINDVSLWKSYNAAAGFLGNSSGRNWSFSQSISGLPAGTYVVTYQSATYNMSDNQKFTINGMPAYSTDLGSSVPNDATVANNFAAGMYTYAVTVPVDKTGKIEISVLKEATKQATGSYFDNFNIKCIGLDGIPDMEMYERVKVAIDDAKAKANDANLDNYRNGQVETLWAEKEINGDGWAEINKTYKNLGEAVLAHQEIPYDYTYAIVNPSFELYPDYKDSRYTIDGGFPFGWSYPANYAKDSGVWAATNVDKAISNPDGEYIFNTWPQGNTIYQDITLTPGLYKLTAKVASDAGNKIYLYAGDKNNSITTSGKGTFDEIELNFPVYDGKPVQIGVTGAAANGSFAKEGGAWYKVDDFHLTHVAKAETIEGIEKLQLAINQATERAKKLNSYDDAFKAEMDKYQAMIDNYTLQGNGDKEFEEVFTLLRAKVFAQPNKNAAGQDIDVDYTYAIINNSFEWGNTYGWELASPGGDTGAKLNSDGTYTISSCDGQYIFNTYEGGKGSVISQTIKELPAGHYKLQAVLAHDENQYVFLEVKGSDDVESQRKMFTCSNPKSTGEVQILEFDVAEGTPQITIRAGGGTSDGHYTENGGTWYKIDNFKLTRTSDPKICFFYQRLGKAIEEANHIAAKLPEYYAKQWDAHDYQDLLDEHLGDGHEVGSGDGTIDPLDGGSGTEQIKTLYQRLRDLIFSQIETGADMTGAITNNSFELGDETGWTIFTELGADFRVIDGNEGSYYAIGTDGKYLANSYYGNRQSHPIYQVIPNVPAGRYTLKVKIASDAGAHFFLGANMKHSEIITIPASTVEGVKEEALFHEYEFTFEVPVEDESKDVKIGLYPTELTNSDDISDKDFADDAIGPWFKVDDFRLTLDSRYMEVKWEMESETHGTIMLPFAVNKETLDGMGLAPYTIKMTTISSNVSPADEDINTYRILEWDGPHDGILANVPYVLKKEEAAPAAAPAKVRAKAEEGDASSRVYTFTGYTQKTPEDIIHPEGNLLTGTLIEVPAEELQHHLTTVDDNIGFMLHSDADDNHVSHETVPAYHAYIQLSNEDIIENNRFVTGLFFEEPVQHIDWQMETDTYGTLILPFDAPLPDGLKAYRLLSADEDTKSVTLGDTEGAKYQILNRTEVTDMMDVEGEDGNTVQKVKLSANTPYLIELTGSAPKQTRKRVRAKAGEADETPVYQFAGHPTNTEESYKLNGLMTGVIVSRDDNMGIGEDGTFTHNSLDSGDRVLTGNAVTGYKFEELDSRNALPRYHAYIDSTTTNGDESKALANHLYIAEPDYTVEWSMDGQDCGTIILPFDAVIPEGLVAYTISSADSQVEEIKEKNQNRTYRKLVKVDANTLYANRPYIMMAEEEDVTLNEDENDPNSTQGTFLTQAPRKAAGKTYTFTGQRGANENPEDNGVMVGTYTPTTASEGDFRLISDGNAFGKVTDTTSAKTIDSLHAYIPKENVSDADSDYLFLTEPEDVATGIAEIMEGDVNVDVYDMQGVLIMTNVKASKALRDLAPGIYVLSSGEKSIKVMK